MTGRIIKSISSFYYVDIDDKIYECKARGIFKHENKDFYVGDFVEIEITDEDEKKTVIVRRLPRKNLLKRPSVANITQAVLVFAIKNPTPNLSLIDRFLVLAQKAELKVLLVFNKIDLDDNDDFSKIKEIYETLGFPVVPISAVNELNTDDLKKYLKNEISVIAGPSGVGKSTLINSISDLNLKTGEVSEKIGRGKHTTRYAELIRLSDDTFIVDTPGFSSIDIFEVEETELKEYFGEFFEFDEECRFGAKCLHENEPSCTVKDAVSYKKISKQRYESYLQLLKELRENRRRTY